LNDVTNENPRSRLARAGRFALPSGATRDAGIILSARTLRGFGDGFVSVLLPVRLADLGFSGSAVGAIASATLFGSAFATLASGIYAGRIGIQKTLMACSMLMVATGIGFATATDFWLLLMIAFVGTLNPTAGDVSVFLPVEQAALPSTAPAQSRTSLFGRYRMLGSLAAAFGALCAGLPSLLERHTVFSETALVAAMFVVYAGLGLIVLFRYRHLSDIHSKPSTSAPLGPSKRIVYRLTALFAVDSFASGLAVQSLVALWLNQRFGFSVAATGLIFFWLGLLTAVSQLLSAPLAKRFGLVNVMVFSHLPANLFLMLTPFMPTAALALMTLTIRALMQAMDAPARSSYVMAVVTEPERPAASAITNTPRSFATAFGPAISGWMLSMSTFGLPLLIAGALKVFYDLALWRGFRALKPPEEES
jgi:MFS family permease